MMGVRQFRDWLVLESQYRSLLGARLGLFLEEVAVKNFQITRAGALLTSGLAAVGLILHGHEAALYIAGIVVGLVIFFVRVEHWRRIQTAGFLAWVLAACALLDAHDVVSTSATLNLLGAWTVTAALVIFRPAEALVYFGLGAVSASLLVWVQGAGPEAWGRSYIPMFTAAATGYFVSRIAFGFAVREFSNRKQIEEQLVTIDQAHRLNKVLTFSVRNALTEREQEVLALVPEGASNQSIADRLYISLDTTKKHVYHIFQKSGASSRHHLARLVEGPSEPMKNPTNA